MDNSTDFKIDTTETMSFWNFEKKQAADWAETAAIDGLVSSW